MRWESAKLLPPDVEALFATMEERPDGQVGRNVSDIYEELRKRKPGPLNREVEENLLVASHRVSYTPQRLIWEFVITGETSGIRYGSLLMSFLGTDVKDAPMEALGIGLQVALNHPADVPDDIFDRFAQLTGWPGFSCEVCDLEFPTWLRCVAHEHDVHGIPIPDGVPTD